LCVTKRGVLSNGGSIMWDNSEGAEYTEKKEEEEGAAAACFFATAEDKGGPLLVLLLLLLFTWNALPFKFSAGISTLYIV
jgi:hypothetical protein